MAITNGYCTLAQVKAALRITDSTDDTLLEGSVESASRLIDGYAMRSFYNAGTAARVFSTNDSLYVQTDDMAGTAVTIETSTLGDGVWDVTFAATDYQLEPLNGTLDGITWAYDRVRAVGDYVFPTTSVLQGEGQALVRITATWGWPAIPKAIETATIIQATRIFKRFDSPLGVAGFGDFGAVRVSRFLDPDVEQLVQPYRKMRNAR
jgi:hypothetical protein